MQRGKWGSGTKGWVGECSLVEFVEEGVDILGVGVGEHLADVLTKLHFRDGLRATPATHSHAHAHVHAHVHAHMVSSTEQTNEARGGDIT